jgi:hypothetical protein
MSNTEEDAALLRFVRERSAAKQRRALLESELRVAGRALFSIGGALREVTASGTANYTPRFILPEVQQAPEICGLDRIQQMLQELKDIQAQLEVMDRQAVELGIA